MGQVERRVHGGPLPLLGLPDPDRVVQGPLPTPKVRVLEMVGPTHFTASLTEPPVPGDSTSNQAAEQLPLYNAYSIDGDVTGELVYVNYGVPKDYEELQRRCIDVRGRSSSRAMAARGAASSPRWPASTAPSLHHLLRSARGRLLPGRRPTPRGATATRTAASAAQWPTCRSTPEIR